MQNNISVIVPVYNVEQYVETCLRSIIRQEIKCDVECILVDDCGNDKSIEIAAQIISNYKGPIRFQLLRHKHNSGLSASRNTAIKYANGEYLYFLDSDDYLYDSKSLGTLWDIAERYSFPDIVQGNLYSEDIGGLLFSKHLYPSNSTKINWIKRALATLSIPESACNRLIKRDLIIRNDILFKEGWIQEDTLWTYRLHDFVHSIAFSYEPTYFYRKNPDSIMHSSGNVKEADAFIRIFNEVYSSLCRRSIKLYDIKFLELMELRVEKAIGKQGYQRLLPNQNIFFKALFVINSIYLHHINNIFIKVICKSFSLLIRALLCSHKIFLYKYSIYDTL